MRTRKLSAVIFTLLVIYLIRLMSRASKDASSPLVEFISIINAEKLIAKSGASSTVCEEITGIMASLE